MLVFYKFAYLLRLMQKNCLLPFTFLFSQIDFKKTSMFLLLCISFSSFYF